ncbi:ammonium transporter [Haloechinothrix sp. YIM 98757]|uniref:Ammonium transporter n=1 Tax=Haloechinothrix aidingensis TaxID=2752311 RepID=A0A838AG67_9PSEU|nr:ammonium transporter [Haloechinothrix aidingensis]MBA0128253.1 ammonium transporter [Haloechinothrix aidingensis]
MDSGDTAWLLISAALVLLMTPGLALFYGGMVRSKSVLNMMMMCFGAIGVVGVLWLIYGYSIAYGDSLGYLLGDPGEFFGLSGLMGPDSAGEYALEGTVPASVDVAFQAMFAVITVALIAGAIADRARYGAWLLFAAVWATLVYFPVAHWVWGGGWVEEIGTVDFAGGTAVHINSGAAALALAVVLGRRKGWLKEPMKPHNLPLVMLGAALLWFGWFGFNAGSAYAADGVAGIATVNTFGATAAAMLGWLLIERIRDGHPTSLGAASGIVAGLVGITPAAAHVDVWGGLAIGFVAGILCALAVGLKYKLGYDDSLDVVGIHMVGGLVGTAMIGLVATEAIDGENNGLFYGGGIELFGLQLVGAIGVMIYSFVLALIIGFAIQKTIGFRVSEDVEVGGIDENEHAEVGYEFGPSGSRRVAAATSAGAGAGPKTEGSKA